MNIKEQERYYRIKGTWREFIMFGAVWVSLLIFIEIINYEFQNYLMYISVVVNFSIGIILKIGENFIIKNFVWGKIILLVCAIISIIWSILFITIDKAVYSQMKVFYYIVFYMPFLWLYGIIPLIRAAFTRKSGCSRNSFSSEKNKPVQN